MEARRAADNDDGEASRHLKIAIKTFSSFLFALLIDGIL